MLGEVASFGESGEYLISFIPTVKNKNPRSTFSNHIGYVSEFFKTNFSFFLREVCSYEVGA